MLSTSLIVAHAATSWTALMYCTSPQYVQWCIHTHTHTHIVSSLTLIFFCRVHYLIPSDSHLSTLSNSHLHTLSVVFTPNWCVGYRKLRCGLSPVQSVLNSVPRKRTFHTNMHISCVASQLQWQVAGQLLVWHAAPRHAERSGFSRTMFLCWVGFVNAQIYAG